MTVGYTQVQFAIDDPAQADAMIDSLLARRLVACGQRTGPVSSRYWWNDSIHHADEWLVLLKTRSELTATVVEAVVNDHPYDTPEVIATTIAEGSAPYLEWIDEVTAVP